MCVCVRVSVCVCVCVNQFIRMPELRMACRLQGLVEYNGSNSVAEAHPQSQYDCDEALKSILLRSPFNSGILRLVCGLQSIVGRPTTAIWPLSAEL